MNEYKIEVANEAESKEVQELFFEMGYEWAYDEKLIQLVSMPCLFAHKDKRITCSNLKEAFENKPHQQVTLPELRILALLKRNDVNDATHEDEDGEKWFKSGDDYYISGLSNEWIKSDKETAEYHNVEPIQKKESEMSNLISGKEAKLAWANGQEVQARFISFDNWFLLEGDHHLSVFDREILDFRLKPQTITVTLELPKPFKPELWDKYWYISPHFKQGYTSEVCENDSDDNNLTQFGAYRTEEEVKQVVAAKRAAALEALNV